MYIRAGFNKSLVNNLSFASDASLYLALLAFTEDSWHSLQGQRQTKASKGFDLDHMQTPPIYPNSNLRWGDFALGEGFLSTNLYMSDPAEGSIDMAFVLVHMKNQLLRWRVPSLQLFPRWSQQEAKNPIPPAIFPCVTLASLCRAETRSTTQEAEEEGRGKAQEPWIADWESYKVTWTNLRGGRYWASAGPKLSDCSCGSTFNRGCQEVVCHMRIPSPLHLHILLYQILY